jgi:hypothetical protein
VKAQPSSPILFTDGEEFNPSCGLADFGLNLQHQLFLMIVAQLPDEGAVLHTVEAVIQAEIYIVPNGTLMSV